jgi:prepilin-type N-terminal cleavage/methylation domain-containing protein
MRLKKIYQNLITIRGFSLIELMVVVAIIAVLSVLSVPRFTKFLAKAKRAEAYINLGALALAQKSHFAEHGNYSDNLEELGWQPEGQVNYTYGFSGTEGKNYVTGKLQTPASELRSKITPEGFTVSAAGYIYSNNKADVLTVDENNAITVVQDGT